MRAALNLEQLLQPAPGGIGRYTAELARLLPAFRRRTQTRSPWSRSSRAIAARTSKVDCASSVSPASTPSCSCSHGRFSTTRHLLRRPRLGVRRLATPTSCTPSVAVPPKSDAARRDRARRRAAHLPRDVPRRGRRFHTQGLAAAAKRADLVITVSAIGGGGVATYTAIPPERMRRAERCRPRDRRGQARWKPPAASSGSMTRRTCSGSGASSRARTSGCSSTRSCAGRCTPTFRTGSCSRAGRLAGGRGFRARACAGWATRSNPRPGRRSCAGRLYRGADVFMPPSRTRVPDPGPRGDGAGDARHRRC